MSVLFITLLIVALIYFWWSHRRGYRDDFVVIIAVAMALALAACGERTPGTHTPLASTYPGQVHWGVTYAPATLYLEVDVRGDDHVNELTLKLSKAVDVVDYSDLCVQVQPTGGRTGSTWFALPHGDECVLSNPDRTQPLTQGKYVMVIMYKLKRHLSDPAQDMDTTPEVLDCKVTDTVK